MKKFQFNKKTAIAVVGVTLPLAVAAVLIPKRKQARAKKASRAYRV